VKLRKSKLSRQRICINNSIQMQSRILFKKLSKVRHNKPKGYLINVRMQAIRIENGMRQIRIVSHLMWLSLMRLDEANLLRSSGSVSE